VTLVPFTGRRVVPGLRPEYAGPLDGNPAAGRADGDEAGQARGPDE
jgi:hypothetical protein